MQWWREIRQKTPQPQPSHQQGSWSQRIPTQRQKGHACHSWALNSFRTCSGNIPPFSWWARVTMQGCSDRIADRAHAWQFDMTLSAYIGAVEEVEPGVCRILPTYHCAPAGFLNSDPPAPPHTYAHSWRGLGGDAVSINFLCFYFPSDYFSMFVLKSCHLPPSVFLFYHNIRFSLLSFINSACFHHSIPTNQASQINLIHLKSFIFRQWAAECEHINTAWC